MDFKALENQRDSTPTPPTVQLDTSEELYEWAENHGPYFRPARIRTTDSDPLKVLEQAAGEAAIVDTRTHEYFPVQTKISYDTSTIQALDAVKQAFNENYDLELKAVQDNSLNSTSLETALQKLEGSIQATGKKVLEYGTADDTMIQVEAGYIDSNGPGTEYGATIGCLNAQKQQPNYTDNFAVFEERNQEEVERIQGVLENETGATFEHLL